MNGDRETILAAWRRHTPNVTGDEMDALLPLIVDRSGLLGLAVDAYRVGRAAALADAHDDEIVDATILDDDDAPGGPAVLEVGLRFNKDGLGFVTLDLDGHLFISVAGWHIEAEAERARHDTETQLRGLLGLAAADPSDAAVRAHAHATIARLDPAPADLEREALQMGVDVALSSRFALRTGSLLTAVREDYPGSSG